MSMIVENLLQFGLDEKEISVYLSLISLGPAPASLIATKAGVNRGTTYDILERLIKLELVSYYKQYQQDSKRQYFVAEPPAKLVDAVENKKRSLDTLKLNISKSLPELESLYEKTGAKPVVKYYEGQSSVRVILQDVLSSFQTHEPKEYYVYSSADIREYLYKAYKNFSAERIKNRIAVKVIALGEGGELVGLDERKWLSYDESALASPSRERSGPSTP